MIINTNQLRLLIASCLWLACSGKATDESAKLPPLDSLSFHHLVIDSLGPTNPWAKIIGDIDEDGDADIIIGGQKGPLLWYRNPDWEKFLIAEGGYQTVDGEAGDVDGDGDLDIVMGGLFWYENPGSTALSRQSSWKVHRIADHPTHDVELEDLDRDGRLDIVTRDQSEFGHRTGNRIYVWWQRDEGWEPQEIMCPHGEGIEVADMDGDEDFDIVIGGIWYEQDQAALPIEWKAHEFTSWHPNAAVAVADLNQDGKPDIVLTPSELKEEYHRIAWFAHPATKDGNWEEHRLQDSVEAVIHGIAVADMNQDGRPDIITSEMHQGQDPDEVTIFFNSHPGEAWESQVVSTTGSHLIQVADMDGDGDPDILGANWSGDYQPVEVWINQLYNGH